MSTVFTVSVDGKVRRKNIEDYDLYLKRKIEIWSETIKYTDKEQKDAPKSLSH